MALLLPDPCDEHCPADFKKQSRELVPEIRGEIGNKDIDLRKALLKFIGDFANWDLAANQHYLRVARGLVKAAHPEETPLVVDPFAGGGSIPLEALRVGCEVLGSDLNPVACLILELMLEEIPRYGSQFADEIRRVGAKIKRTAEAKLSDIYPKDPDGAVPIAYLWARTVRCESPRCGAEIPLIRSFWLCKRPNRKRAFRPIVTERAHAPPSVEFEIYEPTSDKDVPAGTVRLAKATCPCCGSVAPPERVRAQLAVQRGGADPVFGADGRRAGGARMTVIVTQKPGEAGRHYRLPTQADYDAARRAQERLAEMLDLWVQTGRKGPCPVPDEPTPQDGSGSVGGGFRTRKYGVTTFGDLFAARQKLALVEFGQIAGLESGNNSEAALKALAVVLNRCADKWAALVVWNVVGEKTEHVFGRQALPMVWDYCEANPFTDATGGYTGAVSWVAKVVDAWPGSTPGQVQQADATEHPLPGQAATIWFTDPPYYDSVPYADLSDFFLVWLRRTLPEHPTLQDPFNDGNPLSPKVREAVRDEQQHLDGRPKKTTDWYEETMRAAFGEGRRVLNDDGVGCVVFAHKTTEGWEALLSGIIRAGWIITGSWPIATEMASRLRARDSAALATSVHLVCRPRTANVHAGDWDEVLKELPRRVSAWMERLQAERVRGADLVFACIGPALEIFSRYPVVESADGHKVTLPTYLEKVWEAVGKAALSQVLGDGTGAGGLEEDSRLTALFLWTLQVTESEEQLGRQDVPESPAAKGGFKLIFDVVRRFAQPLGIHLAEWENRIIKIDKGVVYLLPVTSRAKQLFGDVGVSAAAKGLNNRGDRAPQLMLFPNAPEEAARSTGWTRGGVEKSDDVIGAPPQATTLDRVHAAMLLQRGGQASALRALLKREAERGPDFMRLANALAALYPRGSEELRLLEALIVAAAR